jgi:copper resistance protein C
LSNSFLRTLTVAVATAFITLVGLGGSPAAAHTGLESSAPADGDVLTVAPDAITMTFTEPVQSQFTQVAVTDTDGRSLTAGQVTVDGPVVRQPVTLGGDGVYVVAYRVVSSDGHPVSGQLTFTLEGTGTGAETATAAPTQPTSPVPEPDVAALSPAATDSSWGSGWPLLAVGAVVVAVVLLPLALRRRGKNTGE